MVFSFSDHPDIIGDIIMFLERRNKFNFAMEMIDFQNDKFGERLEGVVTRIYKVIDNTIGITSDRVALLSETKELAMLVKSRLGFGVDIITHKALAAVMPFYGQAHSIFIPKKWHGELADDFVQEQLNAVKSNKKDKGTVNTAEARVGGVFADVVIQLFIDFLQLKNVYRCTPAETTGIMLHELGHAFCGMEYSDRMDTNNQVLADLTKAILGKKSNKDVNYIFRELKTVNPKIKREEADKLMSSDKTVASYNWFKYIIDISGDGTGTQIENGKYSSTSFEQMADNFASRFGYGRHVTTGLDKLIKSGWSPEKQRSAWLFWQIFILIGIVTMVWWLAVAISGGFLLEILIGALLTVMFVSTSGEDGRDYTYDKLKLRYIRIRNDLVESLKDPKMDKKEVKTIVDNIYVIDGCIKETFEYNNLLDGFLNVFWSSDRRAGKSIQEEQLLEELASNMLFVRAAELRLKI
jgi:hypothetical protein